MRKVNLLVAALFLGCFLAGCGEGPKSEAVVPVEGKVAVFSDPAEKVVVRVGERAITVGDIRDRYAMELAMCRFSRVHSPYKSVNLEKDLLSVMRKREPRIIPQLVHMALLDRYCKSEGLELDAGEAEEEIARVVKKFAAKAHDRKMTLASLAKEVGVDADYMRGVFLVSARDRKARERFDPSCVLVSEAEIDAGLARLNAYFERAVATNRLAWANCSNVLAKVKAGADFKSAGVGLGAENSRESEEWGFFSRDEIENAALRKWAFAAKVGEVGGPFDLNDGLSIVKVLAHEKGTAATSLASAQVENVHLARITFPMAVEEPEPRTREHCRTTLLAAKADKAQEALFTKLFNETKIEYPSGQKLDYGKGE